MSVLRRFTNLFRRSEVDREIADELQAHIDLAVEAGMREGLSQEVARRNAILRFGNPTAAKERTAAADTHLGLDGVVRDVRYAARQLRRSPGFALTAILTLGLGIGANVVVFGVINAFLLRPIQVPVADRMIQVVQQHHGDNNHSYPDYVDFRKRQSAFTDLAAYRFGFAGMRYGNAAAKCWNFEVSSNYFDMLGVQPQLGRFFHASDEHGPNSMPMIVISDSMWRNRFNADPNIIGTTVELNKHPFTIIGVTPKTFNGTEIFFWPEFFLPMVDEEEIEGYNFLSTRENHGIFILGVMKPGVTPQQAGENLNAVAAGLTRENPKADDGLSARLVKPGLLGDTLGGPMKPFLSGIMGLALLLLIAACVNLAGIFAARSADRARELAIRLSIGSTRARILRQVLTEAVLISFLGGVLGTVIAAAMLAALSRWQPVAQYPVHATVVADGRVYAIAFVLSFASGLLPGLLPARQIWRTNAMLAMKSGSTVPELLRKFTVRDVLLAVQITLCALLVTASLVAVRGLDRSLHAPYGFVPQDVMLAEADMHMAGYTDKGALPLQRQILDRLAQIPGVQAVGSIDNPPLSGNGSSTSVYREDTADVRPSNRLMEAKYMSVSPGYLGAARSRLLAGRDFTWDDGPKSTQVVIVNAYFAHKLVGDTPAVGRHFIMDDKTRYEIVGVVEDGKFDSLTEDQAAAMYFPLAQSPDGSTTFVIRSQLPASDLAPVLNQTLNSIDPSLPFALRTWTDTLSLVLFPARIATESLGVMGVLAAMLAVTGIFGMAAYSVSKRLRELGIRVALGAHRGQLIRAALKRPFLILVSGSTAGLIFGVLASRILSNLVYEATPRDPFVLGGTVVAMIVVGLIATWIPARRALSVNPAQLLRED